MIKHPDFDCNSLSDIGSGPVRTSAFSFENAYISMRLGLPSTLIIRSNTLSVFTENASIWKRCTRIDCHSFPDLKSACRGIITTKHGGRAWYEIYYASGKRNCLFAVKFCFIQHHDDFIPKINSCSKITRFIWAVPGSNSSGFVDLLFSPVFINSEQVDNFLPCRQ